MRRPFRACDATCGGWPGLRGRRQCRPAAPAAVPSSGAGGSAVQQCRRQCRPAATAASPLWIACTTAPSACAAMPVTLRDDRTPGAVALPTPTAAFPPLPGPQVLGRRARRRRGRLCRAPTSQGRCGSFPAGAHLRRPVVWRPAPQRARHRGLPCRGRSHACRCPSWKPAPGRGAASPSRTSSPLTRRT